MGLNKKEDIALYNSLKEEKKKKASSHKPQAASAATRFRALIKDAKKYNPSLTKTLKKLNEKITK